MTKNNKDNKWWTRWGVILAALALLFTATTFTIDQCRFQQLEKPLALHNEINDKLIRLDNRIQRAQQNVDLSNLQYKEIVSQAVRLRDKAELDWEQGNFSEADFSINQAFNLLQGLTSLGTNWGLIIGILGAVIVIVLVVWLLMRRKSNGMAS